MLKNEASLSLSLQHLKIYNTWRKFILEILGESHIVDFIRIYDYL
jgi:hypothetical protein